MTDETANPSASEPRKQSWAEAVVECVSDKAERERLIRMYDYEELVQACLALGTLALTAKHEAARNKQLERELEQRSSIEAPETPGTWEQRCSALYQVIGCIAHAAGLFDTQDACDALDVAAGRGDVEGLLPWPKDAKLLHDLEAKLANPSAIEEHPERAFTQAQWDAFEEIQLWIGEYGYLRKAKEDHKAVDVFKKIKTAIVRLVISSASVAREEKP